MAKAFGLWLKDYSGESWRAQLAAKKWRHALRTDYLAPSQYETEADVQTRLRMQFGELVHVPQGVAIAWLEWRAKCRVEELAKTEDLADLERRARKLMETMDPTSKSSPDP
jgi:hypothetical protein